MSGTVSVRGGAQAAGPLLAAAMLAAGLVQAAAYWPGIMPWDAVRQYGQAVTGEFDDWHPPAMEWLWRQFIPLKAGPAPMLVLQLSLYWCGFALLSARAFTRGRKRLAAVVAACALLPVPLALMGAVLKDCLMAATLLTATGLLAWCREDRGWILRTLAILLLLYAAALRFNAFLACLPLMVALLPLRWRASPGRLAGAAALCALALLAVMPLANRLLHAEKSGVELSQIIFDLGGITEHGRVDAFPPLPVHDPIAINHRCYTPVKWDPYSFWVDPLCPINFEGVRAAFGKSGKNPQVFWIEAIAVHPIAYAEHRLAHFNINTRFLVHDEVERPVTDQSAPNDWNYRIAGSAMQRAIDGYAVASGNTPLGWPICWLAAALGVLSLVPRLPSRALAGPLALSALLYGLGYMVLSVAVELRYHLWPMVATAIAVVIAAADLAAGAPINRSRSVVATLPLLTVTSLCVIWRVVPIA